jgi:putative salt-induced outer membrane protein YdiY
MLDVVRITTAASESRNCWSGDVDAGYSLASANHQSQFNFDLHVQCRTRNLLGRLTAYDITTGTSSQPSSQNAAALLEAYHLFPQRWVAGGLFEADRNDQLGIDSRFSIGVVGGRFVVQSSDHVWALAGGIVESREQDVDSPSPTTSTEVLLLTRFDWFRLASPQLDLSTTVTVLPSLTESGRWRGKASLSLKWEIVSNFFLRLQFMGDFDTRPGNGGETKTDYNVSTSVGYSFNQ